MKTYGAVEAQLHIFLTSALDESEWSASRSYHITLPPPPYPSDSILDGPQNRSERGGRIEGLKS
jgi:hypothetical protein